MFNFKTPIAPFTLLIINHSKWRKKVSKPAMRLLSMLFFALFLSWTPNKKPVREYYQLTVYHFQTAGQEKLLDSYFQDALIPALHRMKIKNVGVFKSWANDTVVDKIVYVFFPFESLEIVTKIREDLNKDTEYNSTAAPFLNCTYNTPSFTRMETILLQAFPQAPKMQVPTLHGVRKERVYELRSYESPTQERFENKVKMFNDGDEIGLFKRLNFNAIFYSSVIAGSKMPNLMYMTSFENKSDREEHWKNFVSDPYWKKLSAMQEYQNNVSHIDITFLYPTEYSDF